MIMKISSLSKIWRSVMFGALFVVAGACQTLDNHRLNVAYVYLSFLTPGDWEYYGVSGAGQYRRFNKQKQIPSNFPYTSVMSTGVGGILLCTTYAAEPVAYDLACPVERSANVCIAVNDKGLAECPKCGSKFYIFESPGHPVSGPAATEGYRLQVYRVGPGANGEHMVVRI